MSWLTIALLGHFANAGAFVIDKILLVGKMKYPAVYVFYISALALLSLPLIFFVDVQLLPKNLWITTIIAGATFTYGLLAFFTALKNAEASRVVPLVGAAVPLWTLVIAWFALGERLTNLESLGVMCLVAGAVLISYEKKGKDIAVRDALVTILAGALFALSFTFTKAVFNEQEFWSGFIWIKLASFAAVMPLLLSSGTRKRLFSPDSQTKPTPLFFIGQVSGAFGFVLLNYAIELAPRVTIVNALQGVQYAFLFIMLAILTWASPNLLKENFSHKVLLQKLFALVVLGGGLYLIS
jgi:drug/metabolite transporter (DMT)-like permease